jgi:hypothetical protein
MESNLKGKYSQLIAKKLVKSTSSFREYEIEHETELYVLDPGTIVEIYVGNKTPFQANVNPIIWTYPIEIRIVASNSATLKQWNEYRTHCLEWFNK